MHVQGIGSEIWRLYASKGFLLLPLCLGRGLPSNYLILRSEFFPLQPKSRLWLRNYTRPTPCSPLKKELGQLTGTAGSPLQNLETPAYAMVTQTNLGGKMATPPRGNTNFWAMRFSKSKTDLAPDFCGP